MMKTTYYTYGKLKFVYTEEELEQVIDEILKAYDEKTFSFKALCDSVMAKAQDCDKIQKKSNTVYLSNELDECEAASLSDRLAVINGIHVVLFDGESIRKSINLSVIKSLFDNWKIL